MAFFLDVIDTKTNTVATSITLGDGEVPLRIAVMPDGNRGFVTGDFGHMWMLDLACGNNDHHLRTEHRKQCCRGYDRSERLPRRPHDQPGEVRGGLVRGALFSSSALRLRIFRSGLDLGPPRTRRRK